MHRTRNQVNNSYLRKQYANRAIAINRHTTRVLCTCCDKKVSLRVYLEHTKKLVAHIPRSQGVLAQRCNFL